MTEAERARELADRAESEGYIDVGRVHDEVDMRIWTKGARLLAAIGDVDAAKMADEVGDIARNIGPNDVITPDGLKTIERGLWMIAAMRAPAPSGWVTRLFKPAAVVPMPAAAPMSFNGVHLPDGIYEVEVSGRRTRAKKVGEGSPANPCCFDIPGSDRVRGRDDPCGVCRERPEFFVVPPIAKMSAAPRPPVTTKPPVDVSALQLQAAADAMTFAVEDGDVEFLEAWLEDDIARIRREWPNFDLSSLNKAKRAAAGKPPTDEA